MTFTTPDGAEVRARAGELDVARLLATGLTQAEVGARLYLSPWGVRHRLVRLCQRCGARNLAQLIPILHRAGQLGEGEP